MAALGAIGILTVTEPRTWTITWRRLVRCGPWLGVTLVIYIAIWRLGQFLVPETGTRSGLTTDLVGKAEWLAGTVAPRVANPFLITEFSWWTGWIVVALVAAAPIGLDRSIHATALRSLIALATPIACYAPNLVVQESWASSRSLWVVFVVVTVLAGVGVYRLAEQVSRRVRPLRRILPLVAVGFVVILAYDSARQTVDLLAAPNAIELRLVQAAASDAVDQQPSAIAIVPSSPQDSIATTVSFDEFGYPASAATWAIVAMIRPVLIERGYTGPVIVVDSVESDAIPPGATIIDLGEVLGALGTP
jgi:hypothetical protein